MPEVSLVWPPCRLCAFRRDPEPFWAQLPLQNGKHDSPFLEVLPGAFPGTSCTACAGPTPGKTTRSPMSLLEALPLNKPLAHSSGATGQREQLSVHSAPSAQGAVSGLGPSLRPGTGQVNETLAGTELG